jgi:hypothetical protein
MQNAFELSSAPTRIEIMSTEYSPHEQRMSGDINRELTITYGGTRTFDANGRPFDNDND